MSQKSKYDEKMRSQKVYLGEMWDEEEIEGEFHKFLRKKRKKERTKERKKNRTEDNDILGF